MTSSISLNGLDAVSVRLFQPWTGVWSAEVDFDIDTPVVPKGPATLLIGTTPFIGTIDASASGRFGDKAIARVIGGGGGWGKRVSSRQFHNDAGVVSAAVIAATAAEVFESAVTVLPPIPLGVDYERTAGPASRVLAGLDWYVSSQGITTVGAPRVQTPVNPLDVDILTYDPFERRAEITVKDTILTPGAILIDPLNRFDTLIVRDVEQTFSRASGGRASAWCGDDSKPRLATLLANAVNEFSGIANAKTYRYRVVSQNPADGRLTLQAVVASAGAPDSIALSPWYGVPGVKALVTPGTECAVVFLNGDPAKPVVTSFQAAILPTPSPVARATAVASLVTALQNFCVLLSPLVGVTGAAAPACTALTAALSALSPDVPSQTLQVDGV